ncbi:hypothetical protein Bbelb_242530 [Branchiostoma belcheri]|nr:hypothetical protein Bbelb_242530 [Branchiostoma belcheri]
MWGRYVGVRLPGYKRILSLCEVQAFAATVTTRRTCFCVLSTCKNVGKCRASVRGEYHLCKDSYGFGSTQTRRRTLSAVYGFTTRACEYRPDRGSGDPTRGRAGTEGDAEYTVLYFTYVIPTQENTPFNAI